MAKKTKHLDDDYEPHSAEDDIEELRQQCQDKLDKKKEELAQKKAQKEHILATRHNTQAPHISEINAMVAKIDAEIEDLVNNVIIAIENEMADLKKMVE